MDIIRKNKLVTIGALFYMAIIVSYCTITPIGDDMMFHLMRIGELAKEFDRGMGFPVYMFRDVYSYYGYPIPIFYCSFFLYPFAVLVCLGLEALAAYKVMVIAILISAYFSAFFCLKRWRGDKPLAIAGAFVYGIQPYFLIDLFVRSAIGEALAFIFIPLVLLGFWLVISKGNDIEAITYLAVGMTGIICSHVITTVLMTIMLVAILVTECIKRKITLGIVLRLLVAAGLCLLLSLWFIAPLLEQILTMTFRAEAGNGFVNESVDLVSLILPMHLNIVLSSATHIYFRPVQVGGAVLLLIAFVIYLVSRGYLKLISQKAKFLIDLYFFLVICLMVPYIWTSLGNVLGFIQFPWRIYVICSVIGSMAIILALDSVRKREFYKGVLTICTISAVYVLITFFAYFMLRGMLYNVTVGRIGTENVGVVYTTETSDDLYLSDRVSSDTFANDRIVSVQAGDKIASDYTIDTKSGVVSMTITDNNCDTMQWVEFPFLMYKGYIAYNEDDHSEYSVRMSDKGLVEVLIPEHAVGKIIVYYSGTGIQKTSFYISTCSIAIWVIILILARKGLLCKRK